MRAPLFLISTFLLLCGSARAATFLGPSPYLSFADSPFASGGFSAFFLEDFESGSLTTPGVTFTPGAVITVPDAFTDSVDGDDGAIDGSGIAGHSLYSNASLTAIRFTFDIVALGGFLPTHAGIVWTDVGTATPTTGVGPVTFEAFGPGLVSLGTVGPFTLGDGAATGATAEDRFFGVINAGGISAIEIRMSNTTDWEVDHLQYAVAVPEPAPWLLALSGLVMAFAAKRRKSVR